MRDTPLDHEIVSRWRQAQEYQRLAAGTGETPLDDDELDRIRDDYEAALERFGSGYRHDYGWANGQDEKRRLTFRDLEELAGHGELHSYYLMANQPVHAGSRGLLWEIGAVADHVLVAGSSDRGLADPGQLTALSLARLTRTFVLSSTTSGLRWVIYSDAVDALAQRATRAFFRAHVATDTRSQDS